MLGGLSVASMGQEMFNDTLLFVDNARKANGNQFKVWSNCRVAIYCMCLSAESDMSKLIVLSLKKKGGDDLSGLSLGQKDIYDHLVDPSKSDDRPHRELNNIQKKYNYLRSINGLDAHDLPEGYDKTTKLRNKITHYSFSKRNDVYNDKILDITEESLISVREFIKHIWDLSNQGYPNWVDNLEYKDI